MGKSLASRNRNNNEAIIKQHEILPTFNIFPLYLSLVKDHLIGIHWKFPGMSEVSTSVQLNTFPSHSAIIMCSFAFISKQEKVYFWRQFFFFSAKLNFQNIICQTFYIFRIGVESTPGSLSPPDNGESLSVENCTHLELFSRLLNQMPDLKNISIKNCNNVILHPKVSCKIPHSNSFLIRCLTETIKVH